MSGISVSASQSKNGPNYVGGSTTFERYKESRSREEKIEYLLHGALCEISSDGFLYLFDVKCREVMKLRGVGMVQHLSELKDEELERLIVPWEFTRNYQIPWAMKKGQVFSVWNYFLTIGAGIMNHASILSRYINEIKDSIPNQRKGSEHFPLSKPVKEFTERGASYDSGPASNFLLRGDKPTSFSIEPDVTIGEFHNTIIKRLQIRRDFHHVVVMVGKVWIRISSVLKKMVAPPSV